METLPQDLHIEILSYLDDNDWKSMFTLNKYWKSLLRSEKIWKMRCHQIKIHEPPVHLTWKQYYFRIKKIWKGSAWRGKHGWNSEPESQLSYFKLHIHLNKIYGKGINMELDQTYVNQFTFKGILDNDNRTRICMKKKYGSRRAIEYIGEIDYEKGMIKGINHLIRSKEIGSLLHDPDGKFCFYLDHNEAEI